MITSPNAKHEELSVELFRWFNMRTGGYSMADARVDATAVIAALVAATPFDETWTVTGHPLVEWIASNFLVHWKRASQGFAAYVPP